MGEYRKTKSSNLLEVRDLRTYFYTEEGVGKAVDGVSLSIKHGETLGVVGESGCGKSVTALSIMRLIQSPPGKIAGGEILFDGEDLVQKTEKEMKSIRGNWISMIFQEPMTSLNPLYSIGNQIMEAILLHQKVKRREARQRALEMLKLVGIPSPERRINDYPHQLSGGMRQRVMIAIGLACNPKLLIADEPTTALDVTIQAQILDLMKRLGEETGTAIMLITHDLGVVAQMVDNVAVMYAGKVVEQAATEDLFEHPLHPYSEGLMGSVPHAFEVRRRLHTIEGVVPNILELPQGCSFRPRCPKRLPICGEQMPSLVEIRPDHFVRCWAIRGKEGSPDGGEERSE